MDRLANILDGYIEKKRQKLTALSEEIWRYAEVGFQEFRSAQALERCLEDEGFTLEKGVAGIPTAFVARYGSGKPVIGFLGEYDALFDLSQQPGNPQRALFENGTAGHGCGHNELGVGALASALAVKEYMQEQGLAGTVVYYGCPAEEDGSGKCIWQKKAYLMNWMGLSLGTLPAKTLWMAAAAWRVSACCTGFTVGPHMRRGSRIWAAARWMPAN